MKTRQTTQLNDAQREALQARFALRVTARLNEGSQGLLDFYAMVRRASEGWDGTDPVRVLG